MGRRNVRAEQAALAAQLRADDETWVEIGLALRERYGVNARAALRLARGWSQRRAAEEWCRRWPDDPVTSKHFSWWECWPVSGHAPSLTTLGRLAELYECDLADLVADLSRYRHLDHAHHDQGDEAPVNRRKFLAGAAAAASSTAAVPFLANRLGATDVERLRAQAASLYLLDDRHGGGTVYERALDQLDHVHQMLDMSSYNPSVGRRLQVVAGQLTEMAGWLAFDAGRHDVARHLFTEALCTADVAQSGNLKVLVLTSMTLQAATAGRGREALDLAEAAQRAARPFATPKLSSLLTAREGLAHARVGDAPRAAEALARAERQLHEGDDPDDEDWLAFWGPADFYWTVAVSHLSLDRPDLAAHASAAALDAVDVAYPRNQALYLASRARALVARGDVDEGAAAAAAALSRLRGISSGRVHADLSRLRHQLRPHRHRPEVREYLAAIGG